MGLDSVELLVAVEDAFDVSFTDIEAEKIATVGGLYNGVWSKIKDREQTESNKCKSAMLFYKFRSLLETKYNITRKDIVPDSKLVNTIPQENIKVEWKAIEQDLGYILPPLTFSKNVTTVLFIVGITLIFGGFIFPIDILNSFSKTNYWWLMPIFGIIATVILVKLAKPLKTTMPLNNIRELTEKVLMLNYAKISEHLGTSRQEMESVIQLIIQDRLGVDLKEIIPNTSFVDDLEIS